MALRLDGKEFAGFLEKRLQNEISSGLEIAGRPPGLAVIRIGDDHASGVYVANKEKACARIGIKNFGAHLSSNIAIDDVISKIDELNADSRVDGILLQLPLPPNLSEGFLLGAISPNKDVDGLHTLNLGKLLKGESGPRSCTPAGIMALLDRYQIPIAGQRAVVVGRSILVGMPMALMLQAANATVTVAHSRTRELPGLTRQADVLIVAAGKPQMIRADHVKQGAVVVDVGIHRLVEKSVNDDRSKKKLCGDVLHEEVEPLVSAITPVPGGVGPMTVMMLLVNTVSRWQDHCSLPFTLRDLLP